MVEQLTGLEDLKAWLIDKGFRAFKKPFMPNDIDKCNWYACRDTALPCRECETNDGKPVQLVVMPYQFDSHASVEMDLTGEYNSVWYQLKAYGLPVSEFQARLDELEKSLVSSWNVLGA